MRLVEPPRATPSVRIPEPEPEPEDELADFPTDIPVLSPPENRPPSAEIAIKWKVPPGSDATSVPSQDEQPPESPQGESTT
jgi:hypothetical protein